MNELRIVRGRDIEVKIDGELTFGITEIKISQKRRYHAVYEFMSSDPVEKVAQRAEYEIKLGIMTMFDFQIPTDRAFTLSMTEDEVEYSYEDCRVTEISQGAQGNKVASQTFTIEAHDYRERVIEDE